jgi:hypothetical protein
VLLTLAHCARAGAIPLAKAHRGGPKASRRKPTTLGLVLYAAVMVFGTMALIAVLMTVDGGRLEHIVGLQAPQARAARGLTSARGRRPPQQHLRHRAAAGKGMNVRSMGLHEEGDEEGEEHSQQCICDDPMHCYVCFVHHADHGKHGHDDHGHDEHGHDDHSHDEHGHEDHGHDDLGHDEHGHDEHGQDDDGHDDHGHDDHGHDEHGHDDHGDHGDHEEHHHEKALRAQKLALAGTMLNDEQGEHDEHQEHHGDEHGKLKKKHS